MSSITWTAEELSSNFKRRTGICWRVVEAQHINSTMKLVDNLDEQIRLEDLLEKSKPQYPEGLEGFHYLLSTPFRYRPHSRGSRFRRPGQKEGVFYGAEKVETALAEKAFYSLLFYRESPETPLPDNPIPHTVFSVSYSATKALDLTEAPLNVHEKVWTDPDQYEACQHFADEARKANTELIKSHSARCKIRGKNIMIFLPSAFKAKDPEQTQTWHLLINKDKDKVVAISEFPQKERLEFKC